MKKNESLTFESFIELEVIGSLPITYQSIKGVVFDYKYRKEKIPEPYVFMKKYSSEESFCHPFYKNISKIYAK